MMSRQEIKVNISKTKRSYPIIIENNISSQIGSLISDYYEGNKVLLLSDDNVSGLYGDSIVPSLEKAGYQVLEYIIPAGEKSKSYHYLRKGYDLLVDNKFNRGNLIIALGGGVVGDLAGFLAATFMRGIPFVQLPTSLLAQVDSSVGGKTAINHPAAKNMIGSFYQPEMVVIDPVFLKSLAPREFKTGMAEIIKHGFIADKDLADYLFERSKDVFKLETEELSHIIYRSCQIKADIVMEDEKEKGKRALLNYGHTIGHALEAVTAYKKYNHGEAVAIGMLGAARLAKSLGLLEEVDLEFTEELISLYGLPLGYQEDPEAIFTALFRDKKVKNDRLRWVLINRIGNAFIREGIEHKLIKRVLEGLLC